MKDFILKLLLFAAPFAGWQALELFVLPIDYFAFRPWDVMVVRNFPLPTMGPFLPDQHLAKLEYGYQDYVLRRPGRKPKLTEWVTDQHGNRDRPRDKEPDRYEVVVHGDSNIVGSFLNQADTLSEVLERRCGCPVYSTTDAAIWRNDDAFTRRSPRFLVSNIYPDGQPETLLSWRFTLDGWHTRKPATWPTWVYVLAERFLKQVSREYWRAHLGWTEPTNWASNLAGVRRAREARHISDEEAFAELERRAIRMSETYRALGTDVIYLFMPVPKERYQQYSGFIARLRSRGIGIVDFPPTTEYPNGYPDDYWQEADSHWTEKAVRETADKIFLEMRRMRDQAEETR